MLQQFRQQVFQVLVVAHLVEARIYMVGHLAGLARQCQLRGFTLAQQVATVGRVQLDAVVAQVFTNHAGLALPQLRQLVVVLRAKGCLPMADEVNSGHQATPWETLRPRSNRSLRR